MRKDPTKLKNSHTINNTQYGAKQKKDKDINEFLKWKKEHER